jgi:5-methylcytosine-specific restriction endonuclease McrA
MLDGGVGTDQGFRVSRIEVSEPVVDNVQAGQVEKKAPAPATGGEEPLAGRGGLIRAPVLVLNLNYVPINICTVRRAITMLGKGKAEQLENHRGQIFTVSAVFDVPSIIRLVYLIRRPFLPRKLSKKEVFLRDRNTCQYCGSKSHDLTLDHVIPRRQHGPHTWENVVAACSKCNLRKAGRTPVEAGMRLRKAPRAPDPNPYLILQNRLILEEWRPYIPWTVPV